MRISWLFRTRIKFAFIEWDLININSITMSTKLRDLIRNIRACKTAAEERALIQKEKAQIRESFSNDEAEYRPRNVAKLLFISMLGHDTDFGQKECLTLITANSYTEKRVGYLGLTQLFNEQSEILMMATNRIRIDLNNQSNYIVALALMALSEICTQDMCRDLAFDVLKLLQNGTAYIKKKAALASTRIVTRVRERIEDFAQKLELLLEDRHHGVLVASLQLCQHILAIQPELKPRFVKFVPPMVRIFKSIISTYSAEYDIGGVSDPFLQIEILRFFGTMCHQNRQLSDEVSDILTQVAAITNSTKNSGNAVLYECVRTVFVIESASALKTLGINILGRFLANKDANSKYISLLMLQKVLKHDLQAVQKYQTTILECLKENDNSIKILAIDLLYLITNEINVKTIVKELLNHLLVLNEEDAEFLQELVNKVCQIVEKHAPSRRWYVDIMIKVLILAGNYVDEDSSASLIHLIIGTPELQSYAVHKLFFSLQQKENLNQKGLARTTAYCVGDFGHLLLGGETTAIDGQPIQITEEEVVDLLGELIAKSNDVIKEYTLSALFKLYPKLQRKQATVKKLIQSQIGSNSVEVAKRASEYSGLLEGIWDSHRLGICESVPASKVYREFYEKKPIGDVELDEYPPPKSGEPVLATKESGIDDPFNILESIGRSGTKDTTMQPPNLLFPSGLAEAFAPVGQQPQPQPQTTKVNLTDPFQTDITKFDIVGDIQLFGGGINLLGPEQVHTTPSNQSFGLLGTQTLPSLVMNQPSVLPQTRPQPQPLIQPQPPLAQFGVQQPPTQPAFQMPVLSGQNPLSFVAFDDGALEIQFNAVKESSDLTTITALFSNKTASSITEMDSKAAVQKHLQLKLTEPSSNTVLANSRGQVQQTLKITNTQQGLKGIVLKLKVEYTLNGLKIVRETTCNKFPQEY